MTIKMCQVKKIYYININEMIKFPLKAAVKLIAQFRLGSFGSSSKVHGVAEPTGARQQVTIN